jgi:FkbH-like protein
MASPSAGVATGGAAGAAPSGALSLDDIIDAAIEQAPEAVRRRVILQAIDWFAVDPARVTAMLTSLGRRQLALPRDIATAVLLAGHAVPTDIALSPELRALSDLNRGVVLPAAAIADLARVAENGTVAPEVAAAIVKRLAALGADEEACVLTLAAWRLAPEGLGRLRAKLAAHLAALPALRVRVAGLSTTDTLASDLGLAFGAVGRNARVVQSGFGAALATLLQPDADSDLHILLLDFDGLAAPDWRQPQETVHALLIERADSLGSALAAFAAQSPSPLLINSLPVPSAPAAGLLDCRHLCGLRHAVHIVNERLLAASERHGNVLVIDADQALADIPSSRHRDPKLWFYGRIAYSAEATRALADAFARAWTLLARGPAKVLAVDLDNTLWGGTYGEDGIERLACSENFPGNAFQAFQQECLRLKRQGLLLVALSKNDPDAVSVLARHPGMLLKPEDFAATAVNWQPKPENIRHVAAELNLGLDSFVFLDDSPHERDAMRRLAPEVMVPELPADPAQRPSWLRRLACTWPVRLTEEDARRSEMYAAERGARALQASATTLEDYLRGLEQCLTVSVAGPDAVVRVAQMHLRTNQFNLTTRRLTEADVAGLVRHPERGFALIGRVVDKFGDHGVVIAATVSVDGPRAEIATFLMSCRVIGREIERAFLAALLTLLARRGVARVIGRFAATAKNGMVRGFYSANGFTVVERDDNTSVWAFDLRNEPVQARFVSVVVEA